MNISSLRHYIRLLVEEQALARVPNQLVNKDEKNDKSEDDKKEEDLAQDVSEFSSVGGGSVMGFSAPLGMSARDLKKRKKVKASWS